MTELIEGLYPIALDCDISPSLFWNSSFGEISDLIESYTRRKTNEQKQIAMNNYILAETLSQNIAIMFSNEESRKDMEVKHLWDFYPGLFDDLEKRFIDEKSIDDYEQFKSSRKQFAKVHNRKYEGDGDM